MPVGFVVSGRDLDVVLVGEFTPREAEATIHAGLRLGWMKPMRLLVEMQNPALPPKPEEIPVVADVLSSVRASITARCAFVVTDMAYVLAMNDLRRKLAPLGLEIAAFYDVEAARSWIMRA